MPCFTRLLRNFKRLTPYFLVTLLLGSCQSNPPQSDSDASTPEHESDSASTRGFGVTSVHPTTEHLKIALVIGNNSYEYSALPNPIKDAKQVAESLKKIGFQVQLETDLTSKKMGEALNKFYETLRDKPGSIGFLYFAGHGAQAENENYLIPINNGEISKQSDLQYDAVGLSRIQGDMDEAKTYLNILILDACRNNPYKTTERSSTRGLSPQMVPSGGTRSIKESIGSLIAYSTAGGEVASDEIGYAEYLSKMLIEANEAGTRIDDMFMELRNTIEEKSSGKQIPWVNASLGKPVCFGLCKGEQDKEERRREEERLAARERVEREQREEAKQERAEQQRLAEEERVEREQREKAKQERAEQQRLAAEEREEAEQERAAQQRAKEEEREERRKEEEAQRIAKEQEQPVVVPTGKLNCKQLFDQWQLGILTAEEENFLKNQCNYSPSRI